jgi:hypothetical protein
MGRSFNSLGLYLLPCVRTQTQSRILAESFNTIYSLAASQCRPRCLPAMRIEISWKGGSCHYLETLYANQDSPVTITANGERGEGGGGKTLERKPAVSYEFLQSSTLASHEVIKQWGVLSKLNIFKCFKMHYFM